MEEPPAQVPRHTTSLTRLWRRHDLADSVAKFLPTQALAVLPNLSRSFEQDKFRMLLVAMRASKSAAACTGALLSTLQTSGRDAGHYHYTWDRATGKGRLPAVSIFPVFSSYMSNEPPRAARPPSSSS